MVQAKIYKLSKTAMQSGKGKTSQWILEFCPQADLFIDPLMRWRGSNDTSSQLRLTFPSRVSALAYAEKNRLTVQVEKPHSHSIIPKSYAANFLSSPVV